jgi:hypothetical protein
MRTLKMFDDATNPHPRHKRMYMLNKRWTAAEIADLQQM